jgi:hypothetical protein
MAQENMNTTPNGSKKYWFVAKTYGWGWTPATWQGWAVLVVFLVAIVLNFFRIDGFSHSVSDLLINFVPQTLLLILILVAICWKTGEKPSWQWGDKK